MNDPRYLASEPWQKQFASAVRNNVNAYFKERGLSTKGDGRMVVKTIAMLAMYLAPFVLLLTLPISGWWAFPLAVLMGVGMAGIGMAVMHDAVHGSASSHQWLNKTLGSSMYLLGSNVLTWKIQHNVMHHTHTNINEVDQDIDSRGLLRFSEHAKLKWVHRFQHVHAFFFYGLLTITKLVNDFFMLVKFNRAGLTAKEGLKPKREVVKLAFMKAGYLAIFIGLPMIFSALTWWQVLLGFFVMHFVSGVILGSVFQLAHVVEGADQPVPDEQNTIHNDWAVHEVLTTSDFARNNRFLNWYVGGLNFQIEHHLFPHISHLHYRKIAPIVERTALEFGLKYNLKPSFFAALASHARRLKQLGRPQLVPVPVR
ncbi:MAG: acyl-CoA desaturase [Flavobacteriales bacterium]|nr:acyl-CoA desaturase [Flavobacteriales bacterium]